VKEQPIRDTLESDVSFTHQAAIKHPQLHKVETESSSDLHFLFQIFDHTTPTQQLNPQHRFNFFDQIANSLANSTTAAIY
jgi:hypothetical protein